jgi:precorrin-3B synthase
MPAADGLLVRVAPPCGTVSATQAYALAELALRDGTGRLDLSARGNLQIRGVREATLSRLQLDLVAIGLFDPTRLAHFDITVNPLAALSEGSDWPPLVAALEGRLVGDPALRHLPPKFNIVIDDGQGPSLADVAADLRFDWRDGGFLVSIGGPFAQALPIARCAFVDLFDHAVAATKVLHALFQRCPDARRARHVVETMGQAAIRDAFRSQGEGAFQNVAAAPSAAPTRIDDRKPALPRDLVGRRTFGHIDILGLAAPFGRLDAAMLRAVADLAAGTSRRELRLTPWRVILVPNAPLAAGQLDGFILDPADASLSIAACVGSDGCAEATVATHEVAHRLAQRLGRTDKTIHISGCAKGCARVEPADYVLVGQAGRFDLVRKGRPGDAPCLSGLDQDAAIAALAAEVASP